MKTHTLETDKRLLFDMLRQELVDSRVMHAMQQTAREKFLPASETEHAYKNVALPIGNGQTISQPSIVALMIQSLNLGSNELILEIGTGLGYQAAVLSKLCREVISVERISLLASQARRSLYASRCLNVKVFEARSSLGWPDKGPYDAIIVAAAAPSLPQNLLTQLKTGGRLVIPIGSRESQQLTRITKTGSGISFDNLGTCRFVPLIGEFAWNENHIYKPQL